MIVKIQKSTLHGNVRAIASKSYAHRMLIATMLTKKPAVLKNLYNSADILATISCLNSLGVTVHNDIVNGTEHINNEAILDVNESGSTLRFMLSIVSAIGGKYKFCGKPRLLERPNDELFKVLEQHGMTINQGGGEINLDGKLTSGTYSIRGDISSQYITGLLMALPTLDGDSDIVLTTKLSSSGYIDITIDVLKMFGIAIARTADGYHVKGNQRYVVNDDVTVEADWSNSAFFLTYGVVCGGVIVDNLNMNSMQGDKRIIEILQKMGAEFEIHGNSVICHKSQLKAIEEDVDDVPDAVPILAVASAVASGKTVLKNIQRLKIKESDRVATVIEMLSNLGVKAEEIDNNLVISGGKLTFGAINSHNDHRIAMAGAIAGLIGDGVVIECAEAVNKSYPTFYDDVKSLGGIIDVDI